MGLFDLLEEVLDTAVEVVKLPVAVVREVIPDDSNDDVGDKTLRQVKKILKK